MSNREKIILVLMGLAVLYGAYTYLWPSGDNAPPGQAKKSTEELNTYVLGIAASLPQMTLTKTEKYVIASAGAQWPENPFLTVRMPEKEPPRPEEEEPIPAEELNLRYTGYVEMSGRRLAVVNGIEYAVGEWLKDVGYKIARIDPKQVIIESKNQRQFILPIEEDSFYRPQGKRTGP